MGYATQDDLVARFGETELIQLTDREQTGTINAAILAAKLADADAEIDPYLAGRYRLPLSPVPVVLRRLACEVTRYHLYDDHATEDVIRRYKEAIAFLRLLSEGKAQLGLSESGEAAPTTTDLPRFVTTAQRFSTDQLKDFTG